MLAVPGAASAEGEPVMVPLQAVEDAIHSDAQARVPDIEPQAFYVCPYATESPYCAPDPVVTPGTSGVNSTSPYVLVWTPTGLAPTSDDPDVTVEVPIACPLPGGCEREEPTSGTSTEGDPLLATCTIIYPWKCLRISISRKSVRRIARGAWGSVCAGGGYFVAKRVPPLGPYAAAAAGACGALNPF